MTLSERWSRHLNELGTQGRYRQLFPPRGIDLTSNDYLGHGKLLAPAATVLPRSGAAARLLRGQHPIWNEVEAGLAEWHRAESCLMMTSGYAANEGLLSTVIAPEDWVASDELNHASIIDGLRLSKAERFIYRHQDLSQLESALQAAATMRVPGRELFVVTESLFGMDGDLTALEELLDLAERFHAHVIVDEAHATGCHGPRGSGLVDAAGLRQRVLATVHTGGKALGVTGAYICGSHLLRDWLINRCRHFIFTTALPPQVGAWWQEALPLIQADDAGRARLQANAALFRAELERHGVSAAGSGYIVPVVVGSDAAAVGAAELLQQLGYDIRALRPPSVPEGTARLRIAIHADHEAKMLRSVAEAVAAALRVPVRRDSVFRA